MPKRNFTTLTSGQLAVYKVLRKRGPLTDGELVALYPQVSGTPQSPSGVRTRRNELVSKGFVTKYGRVSNVNNRTVQKWRAV